MHNNNLTTSLAVICLATACLLFEACSSHSARPAHYSKVTHFNHQCYIAIATTSSVLIPSNGYDIEVKNLKTQATVFTLRFHNPASSTGGVVVNSIAVGPSGVLYVRFHRRIAYTSIASGSHVIHWIGPKSLGLNADDAIWSTVFVATKKGVWFIERHGMQPKSHWQLCRYNVAAKRIDRRIEAGPADWRNGARSNVGWKFYLVTSTGVHNVPLAKWNFGGVLQNYQRLDYSVGRGWAFSSPYPGGSPYTSFIVTKGRKTAFGYADGAIWGDGGSLYFESQDGNLCQRDSSGKTWRMFRPRGGGVPAPSGMSQLVSDQRRRAIGMIYTKQVANGSLAHTEEASGIVVVDTKAKSIVNLGPTQAVGIALYDPCLQFNKKNRKNKGNKQRNYEKQCSQPVAREGGSGSYAVRADRGG